MRADGCGPHTETWIVACRATLPVACLQTEAAINRSYNKKMLNKPINNPTCWLVGGGGSAAYAGGPIGGGKGGIV